MLSPKDIERLQLLVRGRSLRRVVMVLGGVQAMFIALMVAARALSPTMAQRAPLPLVIVFVALFVLGFGVVLLGEHLVYAWLQQHAPRREPDRDG